jgi:hypothetical protein
MNSYRIFNVIDFPHLAENETLTSIINLPIEGFTEDAITQIRGVSQNYYGYEYFEFEHEMMFRESGIAFGIQDSKPIRLDFYGYKKKFTVHAYLNRSENFIFISQTTNIVNNLFKKLKNSPELKTKLESYELDLNKAQPFVKDYIGAWFSKVSSRISSSGFFGADLINDPLFRQLTNDGANLSSIIFPFEGIPIQISENAGISSHVKIDSIESELNLVLKIKNEIVDVIAT